MNTSGRQKTDAQKAEMLRLRKIRYLKRLENMKQHRRELRAFRATNHVCQKWVPTPDEITQRAADIRAKWQDGIQGARPMSYDVGDVVGEDGKITKAKNAKKTRPKECGDNILPNIRVIKIAELVRFERNLW